MVRNRNHPTLDQGFVKTLTASLVFRMFLHLSSKGTLDLWVNLWPYLFSLYYFCATIFSSVEACCCFLLQLSFCKNYLASSMLSYIHFYSPFFIDSSCPFWLIWFIFKASCLFFHLFVFNMCYLTFSVFSFGDVYKALPLFAFAFPSPLHST